MRGQLLAERIGPTSMRNTHLRHPLCDDPGDQAHVLGAPAVRQELVLVLSLGRVEPRVSLDHRERGCQLEWGAAYLERAVQTKLVPRCFSVPDGRACMGRYRRVSSQAPRRIAWLSHTLAAPATMLPPRVRDAAPRNRDSPMHCEVPYGTLARPSWQIGRNVSRSSCESVGLSLNRTARAEQESAGGGCGARRGTDSGE